MSTYMNDNLIDDIREKLEECGEKAKTAVLAVADFALTHPDSFAAIVGATMVGVRVLGKQIDIHRADKLRNSTIYDRSLGMYWETKKPLTANQRLVIESRHKAGEPYGKILSDMRILKR